MHAILIFLEETVSLYSIQTEEKNSFSRRGIEIICLNRSYSLHQDRLKVYVKYNLYINEMK